MNKRQIKKANKKCVVFAMEFFTIRWNKPYKRLKYKAVFTPKYAYSVNPDGTVGHEYQLGLDYSYNKHTNTITFYNATGEMCIAYKRKVKGIRLTIGIYDFPLAECAKEWNNET